MQADDLEVRQEYEKVAQLWTSRPPRFAAEYRRISMDVSLAILSPNCHRISNIVLHLRAVLDGVLLRDGRRVISSCGRLALKGRTAGMIAGVVSSMCRVLWCFHQVSVFAACVGAWGPGA